jgi:hypothetical protein
VLGIKHHRKDWLETLYPLNTAEPKNYNFNLFLGLADWILRKKRPDTSENHLRETVQR